MTTLFVVYFPSIIEATNTEELDEYCILFTESWGKGFYYSGNDKNVNLGLYNYFQGTHEDLNVIIRKEENMRIKFFLQSISNEFPHGYDYVVIQNDKNFST
jgi:hypothetical protein